MQAPSSGEPHRPNSGQTGISGEIQPADSSSPQTPARNRANRNSRGPLIAVIPGKWGWSAIGPKTRPRSPADRAAFSPKPVAVAPKSRAVLGD